MQKMIHARRLTAVLSVAGVAALGISASPALAKKPAKPVTKPTPAAAPTNKALALDVKKLNKELKAAVATIGKTTTKLQANVNTLNQGAANLTPQVAAANTGLAATNTTLTATNASLASTKATVTALSAALTAAGTQITTSLTQLGAGLTALQTAIQDPNTGLVGLNAARPRFVALTVTGGAFVTVPGGQTPEEAITVTNVSAGVVVVHFGEDVSERAFVVTPDPGVAAIGQAADCANLPSNSCSVGAGSADDVLLTTQVVGGAGPVPTSVPVTVAALAG